MKNCTHCKYAQWDRTATGRLSPTGAGRCGYEYKLPPLPQAMYWGWSIGTAGPKPAGGRINRREELKEHCAYWAPAEGRG